MLSFTTVVSIGFYWFIMMDFIGLDLELWKGLECMELLGKEVDYGLFWLLELGIDGINW
jgi:hypothetical protein